MESVDHMIGYKIQNAYMLPCHIVIDKEIMDGYEKLNEIIASSRVYLICKIKRSGIFGHHNTKPEVMYVGETFGKKNRFQSHEKLLIALATKKSDEILMVYFLHMRFLFLGSSPFETCPLVCMKDISDIHSKSSVRLLERLLIKLFNPILNIHHNNHNLLDDSLVQQKLIKNNIRYVNLDSGMKNFYFNFVGGRREENEDWYTFDLKDNKLILGNCFEQINILI